MTRKNWTNWKRHAVCCIGALQEQDETSELFGRSWRGKISPLIWRVPILLWSLAITGWSLVAFWGPTEKFFLYMTHWGLLLIILEASFGIVMTLKKPKEEYPEKALGLPWYVKTYWVLYNITIPVAFLISVFYWGLLRASSKKVHYAPNPILDVMIHGVNSVVMSVELISSAHPSRLVHIMQPLYFALAYLLFSVFYFLAGGTDPWGNVFIYPVIDWTKPDKTMVVITLTAVFLAIMHLIVVGVANVRDFVSKRFIRDTKESDNEGYEA